MTEIKRPTSKSNLFLRGVIDFEQMYYAPIGYDLVSNIFSINYFPTSIEYEYYQWYAFTKEHEELYYRRLDALYVEAGLPSLSEYKTHFEYCRAVWATKMNFGAPKLREWRYEFFKKQYPVNTLDGARIDFGDGAWAGIRYSNTSPFLSIFI